MQATVNGKHVVIYNPNYFIKNNQTLPFHIEQIVVTLTNEAKTVMIVQIDSSFAGVFAVADELKTTSFSTIARLKQMGFDVVMLTGDNQNVGKAIARKVGINHFQTDVTPQDKATFIRGLQQKGNQVIIVCAVIIDSLSLSSAVIVIYLDTTITLSHDISSF